MHDALLDMMEGDTKQRASAVESVDTGGLKSIAEMARAVANQEKLVETLEKDLKDAKRQLLKMTDEDLPALLGELGLNAFELDDGSKVTVRPTYGAHIKADSKEDAFEWLRGHGFGDIIKNVVSCPFGRGEDQDALEFLEFAQRQGYAAEQKTDVHPSTLKAWVKERVENGEEFPMELFGAFVGQRATIKRSK